ncbi:hypothetical protein [Bradyrhizobium sp. Tv2a-2]|uniref:hypothetical protein n=1 Tax=Bradyrhizobium sp. Tv2a-2 TaxID=113395 RepID=UPI0004645B2E|nr:hypothetical protein [Bradyrhizobium sp. Tv2a-2]
MHRFSRSLLLFVVLLGQAAFAQTADKAPLARGTAITDPFTLRALDAGSLGLGRMVGPSNSATAPLASSELFALPALQPVRKALDAEFERYIARHKATLPNESIGVGPSFAFQLFDRAALDSPDTRFVLSGIVNRMDRAYVDPASCGEIRLIYRLTPTKAAEIGEASVSPRLPMTLNMVLKAKGDRDHDAKGTPLTCAEIARRWLATEDLKLTGSELADRLTQDGGALASVGPDDIVRIETNLQIAHAPKTESRDFRTDYLMKVFDYDAASKSFEEAPLEDQIDRQRLLADHDLQREFKAWLLDPAHLSELDRGTVLIPEKFLSRSAIAPTPTGFAASNLQPAFGLVAGEDGTDNPVFSEDDVVGALKTAAARGIAMQNIRSTAGFERRLNDVTCAGCHQTRGIGGFHFPGVDWMAAKPSNTVVVPASPHFFGDQVRRRDILASFAAGKPVDFSRGFASRPQSRGSTELAGTEYDNGWGAHCYVQHAKAAEDDASFRNWSCAEGLACQAMSPASRMGMCFVKNR